MITQAVMEAFSEITNYYDWFMEETEHAQAQKKISEFLASNNIGLVLDVATGTGAMLEFFKSGVGVDISPEMLRRAKRKRRRFQFIAADVHNLPFKNKVFAASMSCLAFPWFDDPRKALGEMVRVSKKVCVIEEEGTLTRKRIEVPSRLKKFFGTIEKLEKEVNVEELCECRRVFEADIDGSHKFVCWEVT